MSYQEQAEKINKIFRANGLSSLDEQQKREIIDGILWFGQVAKFRCRSNIAYDNFARECFKDIVNLKRQALPNSEFEVLQCELIENESLKEKEVLK